MIGSVERAAVGGDLRRSPGTRHLHYSPRARVMLVERASATTIERVCREHLSEGAVGFIGHTPVAIDDPSFFSVL